MGKIKVVLGGMSAILTDLLSDLIAAQADMQVVAKTDEWDDVLEVVRMHRADVLIVQGAEAPEPFASIIEAEPLDLLLIDRDGHAGTLTQIAATSHRLRQMSGEQMLLAVRSTTA